MSTQSALRTSLAVVALLFGLAPGAHGETLHVAVELPPVTMGATAGGLELRAGDLPLLAAPGLPALPGRTVRIALPRDADPATVHVTATPGGVVVRPLSGPLRRGAPAVRLGPDGGRLVRRVLPGTGGGGAAPKRDSAAADPDGLAALDRETSGFTSAVTVERLRGWPIVSLVVHPAALDGPGGRLQVARGLDIAVTFQRRPGESQRDPGAARFASLVRGLVVNPEAVGVAEETGEAGPPTLVIALESGLESQLTQIDAYIAHKESRGWRVIWVERGRLGELDPAVPTSVALRDWLRENLAALGITHLLLIGSPDPAMARGIPMVVADFPDDEQLELAGVPTDAWYADVDGDWDRDGDGRLAEYPDDFGPGGVDLLPDLFVGRIPAGRFEVATIDAVLAASVAYETEPDAGAWRRRMLFAAAELFYPGESDPSDPRQSAAEASEWAREWVTGPRDLALTGLYERDGIAPSHFAGDGALSLDGFLAAYEQRNGLVFWAGHGNEDCAARRIWDADRNDDRCAQENERSTPEFVTRAAMREATSGRAHPFVFMVACANAYPERADNLARVVLDAGAAGAVGATRYSIADGSAPWSPGDLGGHCAITLGLRFFERLMDGEDAGAALARARAALGKLSGPYAVRNKLEFNLYGDPTLSLTQCATDADCDDARVCDGAETCDRGFCVAGAPVVCEGGATTGGGCEIVGCVEPDGRCDVTTAPDGAPCDDGLFCTSADACRAGACVGGAATCGGVADRCADLGCDEAAGACVPVPLADGSSCWGEWGGAGACQAGRCAPPTTTTPQAADATTTDAPASLPPDTAAEVALPPTVADGGPAPGAASGGGCAAGGASAPSAAALLLLLLVCVVGRRAATRRRTSASWS